jgi:hypothetical protein
MESVEIKERDMCEGRCLGLFGREAGPLDMFFGYLATKEPVA